MGEVVAKEGVEAGINSDETVKEAYSKLSEDDQNKFKEDVKAVYDKGEDAAPEEAKEEAAADAAPEEAKEEATAEAAPEEAKEEVKEEYHISPSLYSLAETGVANPMRGP